jgi:hypothetical protein
MNRSYWLKFIVCAVSLLLLFGSMIHGEWSSLGHPWDGLLRLATVIGEVASPFVFIYLVVLAVKLKQY